MWGYMGKIRTRVFISLGSFVFFLILLEFGLRIGGDFYLYKLLSETKTEMQAKAPYTILSIGDSYTVGGEGLWEDSYPSQLKKCLSKSQSRRFNVVNGGICEANSTRALNYLSKLVKGKKIDSVILLVGSTNRFNLVGYYQNKWKNGQK